MGQANINEFMDRFHALERELHLFDSVADGQLWWDSVRFDTCEFLFDCLSGLTNSSAHRPHRTRKLGKLRRSALRQLLFARALIDRKDLLVIRTPRSIVKDRLQDAVLDPITDLFPSRSLIINTLPRRYHLPDFEQSRSPGRIPSLQDFVGAFQIAFGLDSNHASSVKELIQRGHAEYTWQVAGYHRLFDKARPRAVLLVQNGIEKALFHAAKVRGIPTVEAQHGLIGHGHPAYSYPSGIDYGKQTTLPDLFLTFSKFWQNAGFYPARRQAVIGTDHFAVDFGPVDRPLGTIMVISANIYHRELIDLTRQITSRLPGRRIIYKLHPNQKFEEPAIRAELSDVPHVEIGDASVPASRMTDGVTHLIAIQSTFVYEALQNGRRICVIPRHNYHIHSDIFDLPAVSVPATLDDLIASLEIPSGDTESPTFFERFDAQRAFDLLAPLFNGTAAHP